MTLLQLASGITKKEPGDNFGQRPSQKARKAALTTATTRTTTGTGVDEQKVDILILEKYIENHFFCVLRFWFYFICCRTHTTLLVDCLHLSWPIGAASATAAVGPLANTFIYELEKHWLNKSNSPGQKNSASLTVFYAFLCSKRYSATSTKIQDTFVVMAAIYEYTWKDNHNNAYWNSYVASSSSPFCI